MKTYYFNTGVMYGTNPYLDKHAHRSPNNVMTIPFDCEDVPENAKPLYCCDNPDLNAKSRQLKSFLKNNEEVIVREIFNTKLCSKYVYFQLPKEEEILTIEDKKQALSWSINGFDLQTIADHFKISKDQLKNCLNTEK